jgi:hypothetical protein
MAACSSETRPMPDSRWRRRRCRECGGSKPLAPGEGPLWDATIARDFPAFVPRMQYSRSGQLSARRYSRHREGWMYQRQTDLCPQRTQKLCGIEAYRPIRQRVRAESWSIRSAAGIWSAISAPTSSRQWVWQAIRPCSAGKRNDRASNAAPDAASNS